MGPELRTAYNRGSSEISKYTIGCSWEFAIQLDSQQYNFLKCVQYVTWPTCTDLCSANPRIFKQDAVSKDLTRA